MIFFFESKFYSTLTFGSIQYKSLGRPPVIPYTFGIVSILPDIHIFHSTKITDPDTTCVILTRKIVGWRIASRIAPPQGLGAATVQVSVQQSDEHILRQSLVTPLPETLVRGQAQTHGPGQTVTRL